LVARTAGVTIFYSDDDEPDIIASVTKLQAELKDVVVVPFTGYGHFVDESLRLNGFPELLAEIMK
jgi:hypothetical protein